MAAGDGENVTDAARFECGPQFRIAAVDLVAGYPPGCNPSIKGVHDHVLGQCGFGREPGLGATAGILATRFGK
ncbi:hypothetical protein IU479_32565 [Nocardia abscessus]|uniref:hypothetical protein n=1 Tax=Nocardia abscessus TaxID=120957 RepID=UPI001893FB09|nr:hypothetical protein [Nocardia abscessus]MBF6222820.1 hypothetical protein [Nocardia abscessus]